jgi:hypothetical protein
MWDGVVIQYANIIKEYDGLKTWLFESGWYLQYYQLLFYFKLSTFLTINYEIFNDFSILLIGIILINEYRQFTLKILNFSKKATNLSSIIFAIFPTWSVFHSSVLTFYLFCFTIGVLSIRFIHSKNKLLNFISIPFLIFSYTFNSLFAFLPILSFIYDQSLVKKFNYKPSYKTVLIFSLSILFYLFLKIINPPIGMYENYNVIIIDQNSFIQISKSFILNFSHLIIPIFIYIFILKKIYIDKSFALLILLFISATIGYILVGKYSQIFDFKDWNFRHLFLLSFSISLIFGKIFDFFPKDSKKVVFIFYSIIFFYIIVLLSGSFIKINRQIFENDLSKYLIHNNLKFNNSKIEIYGNGIPSPKFRDYEANFLYYKTFKIDNNWVIISDKKNNEMVNVNKILNNRNYQLGYIVNTNYIKPKTININISCIGYSTPYDIFKNVLHFKNYRKISKI